jgi:hypothetical protein
MLFMFGGLSLSKSKIAIRPEKRVLGDEIVSTPKNTRVYVASDEDVTECLSTPNEPIFVSG